MLLDIFTGPNNNAVIFLSSAPSFFSWLKRHGIKAMTITQNHQRSTREEDGSLLPAYLLPMSSCSSVAAAGLTGGWSAALAM